jgi:hypothetical protein
LDSFLSDGSEIKSLNCKVRKVIRKGRKVA